jgi:hypothetical protein
MGSDPIMVRAFGQNITRWPLKMKAEIFGYTVPSDYFAESNFPRIISKMPLVMCCASTP